MLLCMRNNLGGNFPFKILPMPLLCSLILIYTHHSLCISSYCSIYSTHHTPDICHNYLTYNCIYALLYLTNVLNSLLYNYLLYPCLTAILVLTVLLYFYLTTILITLCIATVSRPYHCTYHTLHSHCISVLLHVLYLSDFA